MAEKPWKKVMEEMHSSGSPVISRVSFKCGPGITYLTRDLGRNGKDILSLAVHTGACYVDSNDVSLFRPERLLVFRGPLPIDTCIQRLTYVTVTDIHEIPDTFQTLCNGKSLLTHNEPSARLFTKPQDVKTSCESFN